MTLKSQSQIDYAQILEKSRHSRVLGGIASILDWDQETYMPPGSAEIRGEQLKTLAGLIHKSKTSTSFSKSLAKLIDLETGKILSTSLKPAQKAALKVWREDYLKDTCLPSSFVEDFAKLTSQSVLAWRAAKTENDYELFAPYLQSIVAMNRHKAELLGYDKHPYDALLDLYEPGVTTEEVSYVFSQLKKSITELLKKIQSKKQIDDSFLFGKFNEKSQLEFGHTLMQSIGYDITKGRLDLTTHPFSTSAHPSDSRITTRIHPTSLMSNISAIMHECGHSLYEMGLPEEHYGSPLCEAVSLGLHESQSRFWETRIGQSNAFWKHFLPLLKKQFPKKLDKINLNTFYKAINKVEPSLIRIEADEVTYSLHVILRFEIEKELIEGSLGVNDIPEAWNDKMKELFGIEPKNDSEGCLQDIHWSMGSFGYFPTYTLGNLYASHLFNAFEKENNDWEERVADGDLIFIKDWLNHNVHRHGRQYKSLELLKIVTGGEFSADPYVEYLNRKYQDIYGF